jgi:hypothetical protein
MKIPVFVSMPSRLNEKQKLSNEIIQRFLREQQLESRTLGRSDFPTELPLREVASLAQHCSGGIILGFTQFQATEGVLKPGIEGNEKKLEKPQNFPSPWNNLEAGILFGLSLPILVFKEENISGGIFDIGTTDVFIHEMPVEPMNEANKDALRQVFLKWGSLVRKHYYSEINK